jgi:hypothetical protein
MATILPLLPRPRLDDGPTRPTSAEIVIFPGVRYERMAETPAKPKRKRPAKKATDVAITA